MYLFRLDDASDYMDVEKWDRIESILDKYSVKPLVGVIPHNEDAGIASKYARDDSFWDKARGWQAKGWRIAQHGYNHSYATRSGGINPVNRKSEFAGLPLEQQKEKIKIGYGILCSEGLKPDVFFAPSHTFDENTLEALRIETDIRIISDTIANDVYFRDGFYYIPEQTGAPRKLPFKMVTICVHPNTMSQIDIACLESFIVNNRVHILNADKIELKQRPLSLYDRVLKSIYFAKRNLKG